MSDKIFYCRDDHEPVVRRLSTATALCPKCKKPMNTIGWWKYGAKRKEGSE